MQVVTLVVAVLTISWSGHVDPAVALERDATVASMVRDVGVRQSELWTNLARLTGEKAATVGGNQVYIRTRYARSGTPIRRAEQYVYERLSSFGLSSVTYQPFSGFAYGRNVVGEITGSSEPGKVVLIGAHLDDLPTTGRAPGADDNASSCAALIYLAKHLARQRFARTIRFVFFGAEECGYLGSRAYVSAASSSGDDIVATVVADAVAWNPSGSRVLKLHTRDSAHTTAAAGDIRIARTLKAVVTAYGITRVKPRILRDARGVSDHASFWRRGYSAVWVSDDLTSPYFHTPRDTVERFSRRYYVAVVKSLLATTAHLARIQAPADPTASVPAGEGSSAAWLGAAGAESRRSCQICGLLNRDVTVVAGSQEVHH